MTTSPGKVILLNGTSSSGKSSIARELLAILDGTWFHMPVDAFHAMRCDREIADADLQAEIDRTAKGFHRAVAGMAAAGNNVVVDHPLTSPWRILDLRDLLVARDALLICVYCPLAELIRREGLRGDRTVGLAARQYEQVYSQGAHDLRVDTSLANARECAHRIRDMHAANPRPTAFEILRTNDLR